jgi:hypothetical protein
MSDSGCTLEASQIEPGEAFRIEEAVNLDDLAARNRKPHHHQGPPVGHDDNPRGAIDERRNFDCGGLRNRSLTALFHGKVMTSQVKTVVETSTPEEAINVMLVGHLRHLPILGRSAPRVRRAAHVVCSRRCDSGIHAGRHPPLRDPDAHLPEAPEDSDAIDHQRHWPGPRTHTPGRVCEFGEHRPKEGKKCPGPLAK